MGGRDEKCLQYLVGKPEGKKPFGRPRSKWEIILEWILEK
jgi:hypothetical protein